MTIMLKSPYVCLVKTNSAEFEIDPNDTLQIEDEKIIFVYPQNAKQIPFYINLQNLTDCERYSVLHKDNTCYVLLENSPIFKVKRKEKLTFANKTVEIFVEENCVTFEANGKKVQCFCQNCGDFSTFKIKNFACVQFSEDLYVFSVREEKVYHFNGEIEVDGNQITVTKKFHDSVGREKKSVFKIQEDIELEDEEYFSNSEISDKDRLRSLAPYKLLESVKAKDFACAMKYLTEKLQKQIEISQIKEFFGNFTDFLPVTTTQFITISAKSKNFVQFSLCDNLIDDITVDAL